MRNPMRIVSLGGALAVLAAVLPGCFDFGGSCSAETTGSAVFFKDGCTAARCELSGSGLFVTLEADYFEVSPELYAVYVNIPGPLYLGAHGKAGAGYFDPYALSVSGRERTDGQLQFEITGWTEPDEYGYAKIAFDFDGWVWAPLNGGRGTLKGSARCEFTVPEDDGSTP